MDLQSFDPYTGKLLIVLRMVRPQDASPSIRGILDGIREACTVCSELHVLPFRCRVSLTEHERALHRPLAMDLVILSARTVLHVIDWDMQFQNSAFVKGKYAAALWSLVTEIWPSVYSRYPDILTVDRETCSMRRCSSKWRKMVR